MKIYTGYFGGIRKIPADVTPVAICASLPKYYQGLSYKTLAPKWEFVAAYKKNSDIEEYTRKFNHDILSVLDPVQVLNELKQLTGNDKVCLLCYEKPENFCHRQLVAKWFNDSGIKCEEI